MQTKDVLNKVKTDYGLIAEEFSKTRQKPWSEFSEFLKYLKFDKKIALLDVGCGNGRLYEFLKTQSVDYIGIDNSRAFLKIAKQKYPKAKFKYADAMQLPFPKNSFDTVWCIAVLHHLPVKTLRLKACRQITRVLKPKGKLMITVWNLWQKKYQKFISLRTHNALIPWNNKLNRYYYAFKPAELKLLLKSAGLKFVKNIKSLHNLAYIYEKN